MGIHRHQGAKPHHGVCQGDRRHWLHSRLRSGNVHTSDGAVSFIRQCYHKIKDLADAVNACMDSGYYDKDIVTE